MSSNTEAITALAKRCHAIYTAAIADILDEIGLVTQTLPPELMPLSAGTRIAGPAYPIAGELKPRSDFDTELRAVLRMLGAIPTGYVAVYDTGDTRNAHLGELSVISLRSRGVTGAVIDGGCRDVAMIVREGFPVFCRHRTPQDFRGRWGLTGHGDITVTVGDVAIGLGDWVIGDEDGIVVVPAARVEAVISAAERKAGTESAIRTAIRDGATPIAAFEQFGSF